MVEIDNLVCDENRGKHRFRSVFNTCRVNSVGFAFETALGVIIFFFLNLRDEWSSVQVLKCYNLTPLLLRMGE